jgi:hypothetical protein
MEGVAYALTNPEESLKMFYAAVPEIALTSSGRFFSEAGLAMFGLLITDDVAKRDGLGVGDPAKVQSMIDLVIDNLAEPGTPKPQPGEVFDPRFAGQIKLTAAQWGEVAALAKPYERYFRTNGE